MTYHITVREVYAKVCVFSAFKTIDELICDFCTLHPGSLLEGNYVGGNFDICFEFFGEFTGLISVPEVSYVTVFLCFGNCKLTYTCICEIFTESVCDFGGIYKVL